MENIIKLAQKNYDFGLQTHLLNPYFQDLSTKPENVDAIAEYTIKELRAKKANTSLLFLLNAFVDKCPGIVFSQHGSNWLQLLIRNAADNQGNLSLIMKILTNVIHNIVINDCKKELDCKAIEKVVEFCTQLNSRGSVLESLKCLELVLKSYPEHCSFIAKNVNKYLLQFVDNPSQEITAQVGVCFLYLYQVKGGICRGSTLDQSWMQLQNSLLANIYATLNTLLDEEHFVIDAKLSAATMELDNSVSAKPVLCQRMLNLTSYLDTALLMPLPIAKPIYAAKILDLVYRVLEENSPLFSDKNLQRDITIGPFLHHLHKAYLTLMKTLIIVLRSNALLFNKTICVVLKIVLKRSTRVGYHPYQSEYRSQKILIYSVIEEWIQIAKSGQEIENIVQATLDDIWATLKNLEVVVKEKQEDKTKLLTTEKGSKKRKRANVANAKDQEDGKSSKNVSHIVQSCLSASAALQCLDRILFIFGHSLNANLHHAVLTNVHLFAKRLVDASMMENPLWSDDYNLAESVCKVLITFNSSSHHLHRTSINYTLSLLEMIRSCEPQNRRICLAFQNHLETIFHYPRAPVTIVNPASALLQEPELAAPQEMETNEVESSDDEAEEVVSVEDENEITSTMNGQVDEVESSDGKTEKELKSHESAKEDTTTECIEITEDSQSISSEDEQEKSNGAEVVNIGSEDDESVVELPTPKEVTSPSKAKKPRLSKEVDSKATAENQASVADIMLEFVNELV